MEKPLSIDAFWQVMQSDAESGSLIDALRTLREITDPHTVTTEIRTKDPSPLGSWNGWTY